ncbi:uncharacterized protein LOC130746263 [Lotus japonicus]|uniref:uncharacterized protein LOC130746263 n=1 Tax=Lotus japonicus TaxID=34305 RepID=UPI00258FE530|nr:uncharacterized protein LOC130746263 [Lotus japonicus]
MNNYKTKKVFLDQGSAADIIYGDAFDRLGLKESDLKPYRGTLVGFTGGRVSVRGYVEIPTAFGEGEFFKKFQLKYLVIASRANNNALLGRDTLNKLGAIISTSHLTIKYPACNGKIGILRVDQEAARGCYLKSVALYGKKAAKESHRITGIFTQEDLRPQPLEETKSVRVKDKILKIGSRLSKNQEDRLITLLGDNLDLFAWTINDVPGIDPSVITHKLGIRPGAKPVMQARRRMSEEKDKAVQVETNKLMKALFIREVQYPTWLANVVMFREANGKWRMCTDYTSLSKLEETWRCMLIVKSPMAGDHGEDLKEAFAQLRKYSMKLNLEKCSFGIQGGKFLGFMITSRGIEVNPDKCKAILDMKSLANV